MNAFNFVRNSSIAIAAAFLLCGLPAQARFDGESWQPKAGVIGYAEDKLAVELTGDFNAGLIDTSELSMLTRDLDGIREHEDALRMNHNGLGLEDEEHVLGKLAQFQQDLHQAIADKCYTMTVCAHNVSTR